MPKLAICWPWTSEFVWTRCVQTMLNLHHPPGYEVKYFRGDGWCSARRHNHALEQAFHWGADVVCIVGADQTYEPDMLCRLIQRYEAGCQVVAARVPIRGHVANQGTKPFQTLCWRWNGQGKTRADIEIVGPEHGDLVEINGCGSGVLMFPLSALTKLTPPWFFETPTGPGFDRKACADWPFVERLQRNAGLKIWCDTTIKVGHLHVFEIDETYSERFADWKEKGDPTCCEKEDPTPGIIKQVRMSPSIPFYRDKFMRRYGLEHYTTPFLPAFFFGCYTKDDFKALNTHAREAVVIWAGSDIRRVRYWAENGAGKPPFGPNVRHVAISKFIADDLDALGLKYVRLPFCNVDEELFKPVPRAGKRGIFAFVPDNDREKYGGPFIDELQKLLPEFEWIIQRDRNATPEQMREMYEKCFIGVRSTKHDGLSNTVIEMGLMGREVFWNGDTPNAVPYESASEAANLIRIIGGAFECSDDTLNVVAAETRDYLKLPAGWNTTAFHNQPMMRIMSPEIAAEEYDYERYFSFRYAQGPFGAGGPDPTGQENLWTRQSINIVLNEHDCESIIDIGCGSAVRWGDCLPENYTGIDISPIALRYAAKKFPNANWLLRDITKDDIPQADAVICIDVLQHLKKEDFDAVMAKLKAAARKVLIIKTTATLTDGFYQFQHSWDGYEYERVPGTTADSRFIVIRTNDGIQPDGTNSRTQVACGWHEAATAIAPG